MKVPQAGFELATHYSEVKCSCNSPLENKIKQCRKAGVKGRNDGMKEGRNEGRKEGRKERRKEGMNEGR